jgi:hypothetical protein
MVQLAPNKSPSDTTIEFPSGETVTKSSDVEKASSLQSSITTVAFPDCGNPIDRTISTKPINVKRDIFLQEKLITTHSFLLSLKGIFPD